MQQKYRFEICHQHISNFSKLTRKHFGILAGHPESNFDIIGHGNVGVNLS
jgi:hypothetical protein